MPTVSGEAVLVRSLSVPGVTDTHGNVWQYHPRSDRHSKIACWGVLFDLLVNCPLLRTHVEQGKVVFGINHEMTDFVSGRKKNLDLVVCTPRSGGRPGRVTFVNLVGRYLVRLTAVEEASLRSLPPVSEGPVGDVVMALEAKAMMTAHIRAAPRFFDELASAVQCINGSAMNALAVGHTLINVSPRFISPDLNRRALVGQPTISSNPQPAAYQKALDTVRRLPVRGFPTDRGYDGLAVSMVTGVNDGSPFELAPIPPSLSASDSHNYERMILRISGLYSSRFGSL